MKRIIENPHAIKDAPRCIMLAAVKNYAFAIRFASIRLRSSELMAKVVCRKFGECIQFFSEDIKNNREILLIAVSESM